MIRQLQRSALFRIHMVVAGLMICSTCAVAQLSEIEMNALVALYNDTGGENWTDNTNWLSTADVSTWYGIQLIPQPVGTGKRVSVINLAGNNLRGPIPAVLGYLSHLSILVLSDNHLTGEIPPTFGALAHLRTLILSNNPSLSGVIPTELTRITPPDRFWFEETGLCESSDTAFQTWMDAIRDARRTTCIDVPDVPGPNTTDPVGTCSPSLGEAYLDGNNVRARIPNNGVLFYRGEPHVYNVPANTVGNAIFAAGIWIGGLINGQLHTAASRYGPYEFWAGPLDDQGLPPADCSVFDRMYKVDRDDLEIFEKYGVAAGDAAEWPTGLGAPTLDAAGNRIDVSGLSYEERLKRKINWEAGEKPEILTDQAIWWVMNDRGNTHRDSESPSLGLEVHGFAYAARSGAEALNNATFYRYTIFNKTSEAIRKAYFGMFVDPDLGDAGDDYVGSDTLRNIGYVYNADDMDTGGEGYGRAPPAVGIRVLRGPKADKDGFDNDRDGLIDETDERPGLSHFLYYNNGGGPNEDPSTKEDYYNFLRSYWKNGKRVLYGGDGFESNVTSRPANYMYPGDPAKGEYWSEVNTDGAGGRNTPADRRFMLSSGPFDLLPGESKEIDLAVVYGRGKDHLDSITEMRHASDGLQAVFDGDFSWYPVGPRRTDSVELLSPGSGASGQPTSVSLRWDPLSGAGEYQVWLSSASSTKHYKTDETSIRIQDLETNTLYRWSVKMYTSTGSSTWSPPKYFITGSAASVDLPLTFSVVQNASGRLNPPDLGAFAMGNSGFPSLTCPSAPSSVCTSPARGYQQSTSTAIWGIHAGSVDHTYGSLDDANSFLGALIEGSEVVARMGNSEFEWRWVGLGQGGLGYDANLRNGLFDVGFELWNIGEHTPDDTSDDYRMIPVIDVLRGGDPNTLQTTYSIGGDHQLTDGVRDPYTNFTSWYSPVETAVGDSGFNAFVAGTAELGEVVFRDMVLVQLDGGDPPYAAELPEPGTVFRITTGAYSTPIPAAPTNGAYLQPGSVRFYWTGRDGSDHRIQLSEKSDFSEVVVDTWNARPGIKLYLKGDKRYFWRVQNTSGFWSTTSSFVVSEGEPDVALESEFTLHANFPNPFANRTTFSYFLTYPARVRLEVFDMLGRRVSVPVDGVQAEGQYNTLFHADNLTSGMYIYTLTVNDRTVTGKMVVAR